MDPTKQEVVLQSTAEAEYGNIYNGKSNYLVEEKFSRILGIAIGTKIKCDNKPATTIAENPVQTTAWSNNVYPRQVSGH